MKVGFLCTGLNPCQWYRLLEPCRAFPGAQLLLAPGGVADRATFEAAAACDVVQANWVHLPAELDLLRALAGRGVSVAVDYDDNPLLVHADYDLHGLVARTCETAELVTVSTPALKTALGQLHHRIAVLPNRIDTRQWRPVAPRGHAEVVIAYAGSKAHTEDFDAVAPELWAVMDRHRNVVLRLLGCLPIEIPARLASRVAQRPWTTLNLHRQAITDLDADIFIAPLRDTPFNRCRSSLKYMQAGALGVPIVASALPPYRVVEHNRTGLLAHLGGWFRALDRLVRDSTERAWLGASAMADVRQFHDLCRDAPVRGAAYNSIAPTAQRRSA